MGLKDMGDKINEATDTANRWIDDPKNRSSVGVLSAILFIIFLIIISRKPTSPPPGETTTPVKQTQTQEIDWENYDKIRANELWGKIKTFTIIEGLSYHRTSEYGITYYFKFKLNDETASTSTEDFQTVIRTWCIAIAKAYNESQYITLKATLNNVTIASAEYSPISGSVKVQ